MKEAWRPDYPDEREITEPFPLSRRKIKKVVALDKNYGILEPVLGGTAGRRSIRCGGLQLFRPSHFGLPSLSLFDEFRVISGPFPWDGIRVAAPHWAIAAGALCG